MRAVTVGSFLGMTVATGTNRLLRGFLYEVEPTDLSVLVAATTFLLIVAGLASYVPARRAARVDPMVALRAE
jgi:ABC-type lipoprotein release transport system permease subunit